MAVTNLTSEFRKGLAAIAMAEGELPKAVTWKPRRLVPRHRRPIRSPRRERSCPCHPPLPGRGSRRGWDSAPGPPKDRLKGPRIPLGHTAAQSKPKALLSRWPVAPDLSPIADALFSTFDRQNERLGRPDCTDPPGCRATMRTPGNGWLASSNSPGFQHTHGDWPPVAKPAESNSWCVQPNQSGRSASLSP